MTQQLDPWELFAEDDGPKHNHFASGVYANCPACGTMLEHELSKDCWCEPEVITVTGDDFELGPVCNLGDTECEACQ